MKNLTTLLLLCGFSVFAQNDTLQTEDPRLHRNLTAHLIELMQIQGKDSIDHIDSLLNYRIMIPKWWKIRETPSRTLLGGTFPAVEGIENALMLKSFGKENFEGVAEFENWVIKKYKMGDMAEWSDSHTIMLKKELKDFESIGHAYFVQLMRGGKIYHCCYIVAETHGTYLWIDFTATKETYTVNFDKFTSLLNRFEIIKP